MEIFGINILAVIASAGIGGLFFLFVDKAIKMLLLKFYPEKFIIKLIQDLDDKYIDKFKKKYPEAGKELESKISKTLIEASKIILDQ